MDVQELENYGKDILSMQGQSQVPLGLIGPALGYIGGVIRTLGAHGTIQLVRRVREEVERAETRDWTGLKAKGISQAHLSTIIRKIALAKVMAEMMGMERAAQLRRGLSNQISIPVFEKMFAPADVFTQCGDGDFLPPFKQYYVALMDAMAQRGLERACVSEDTPDAFQLDVTYCAWAEVGRALGDGAYCYYSTCYGDEVFFPYLCAQAGFEFCRTGTLAQGAPVCDFRFTRKKAERL